MKISKRLFLTFLSLLLIGQLYSCFNRGEIEDPMDSSAKIPSEYLRLLKLPDSCCNKQNDSIIFIETWTWKYRKPLSFFYVANKYYLQIYKIDTAFSYSIKNAVKEIFLNAHSWTYTPYRLDNRTAMEFLYKQVKPPKPKNVYLDLYGDNTQVLKKNDTIAYYYLKCVNFSIKFDLQQPMDIYGESHSERDSETPIEIMFLEQHNELYLLTLSAKDAGIELKPGVLYNLLFR